MASNGNPPRDEATFTVKAGLALMGRIRDALRLPLVPVGKATRNALAAALRTAGVHAH